jgi:hypothetical protein
VLAQLTRDVGIPAGILSGTVDEIAGRDLVDRARQDAGRDADVAGELGQHRIGRVRAPEGITFRGPHATDPVLAQLTRDVGIPAGILSGTVDEPAGMPTSRVSWASTGSVACGPRKVMRRTACLPSPAPPPALAARLTPGPALPGAGEGKQAVLRITFRGPHATDPVLAQLTRDVGIPAGILSGTVG